MGKRAASVLAAASVFVAGTTISTSAAAPEPGPPELENGPWNVLGEATGRMNGESGGIEVSFFGRFPVEAQVNVPDAPGPLAADGMTWAVIAYDAELLPITVSVVAPLED